MKTLLAAAAVLLPCAAFAGGYVVPNLNPRDLGMSGSAVAAQNGPGAAYANPAALAGPQGLALSASGTVLDFASTWNDTAGLFPQSSSAKLALRPAYPPTAFASYGFKLEGRDVGVGAGIGVPGGGQVYWPSGWAGSQFVTTVDRRIYGMYLTGGVQVLPQLKLGGGLVYYRSTEHLTQDVNFVSSVGGAELGTSGGALSYDLSAEIAPVPNLPLKIGIDYKHQGVMNLTGHAHFDGPPAALRAGALDQPVSHKLTFPNQLNIGASFRPIDPLLLTAGFTFERFVVYRRDAFLGDYGTSVIVPRDYHNGQTYRVGAEYAALPFLRVRAGLLRDISPTNTDRLNPSIPDASSTAFSLGASLDLAHGVELTGAYFFDREDTTTVTSSDFSTLPGSYDTHTHIFALGLAWRM